MSDHGNHCIRRIDLNSGVIRSVAGQCGKIGFSGDGGLATSALLSHPRGLSFTKAGDLLISDYGNSVIRKVDTETGIIVTIVGVGGSVGYSGDDGSSTSAQLNRPTGVAVSASDDYFIADFGNHLIRVVEPNHTCLGISNKNSTVCSGNGFCIASDTCRCQNGYYGEDCSITTCFGMWSNETAVCSSNVKCTALDTCVCDNEYVGNDCSLAVCYGVESSDSTVCSGHGNCTAPNMCDCELGYAASDCSSVTPTGGSIQVSPSSGGKLLITKFKLTTSDWKPTEHVVIFEYRFGVVDPSNNNEIVFLNSFSSSTTLTTTLPVHGNNVTVVVQCRSASGHTEQRNASVTVNQPSAQELSNYVSKRANETLLTVSDAEFESEFTSVCSAIPSIVETLNNSHQVSSLISNLVDTMTVRKDDLSVEMKAHNSKLLSNEIQLFDKQSVLKLSQLLTDTMKEQNNSSHQVLNDAISATKNFATVMISDKSEKDEKLTFLELLDQVSLKMRNELQEGEHANLSMSHLEVVMAKTSAQRPNASLVIPQQQRQQPQEQDRSNVLIQVRTASIIATGAHSPSSSPSPIDVQGQIMEHPTETYVTKCDTTLVSPTISVRFFDSIKQQKIDELELLPELETNENAEPIIATTVDVFKSKSMLSEQNSTLFAFVCKYHVTSNDTWMMNDRVCRTSISPQDSTSVTCMCNQPVTHAVSLDYIQSTTGEAESENGSDDSIPCTNPCGCTSQRKSSKLQPWAKALIGVSVSIVVIVIALLLAITAWIIVKNVFMKRSFADRVATRVELQNVDSPVMALKFCRQFLC